MPKSTRWALVMYTTIASCIAPSVFSANITRGPYLQSCSSTGIVVRWRTDWPSDSRVRFHAANQIDESEVFEYAWRTEHELLLPALTPNTTYFYSVGSMSETLASGANCYFRTHATNARPVRIWAIGDAGTGDANQAAVRDAYLNHSNSESTDVWLMLGDNVYNEGNDDEYQWKLFGAYADMMRHTPFWPALGNHDAPYGNADEYTGIFTLPTKGESGGVPSQTELYYSFNCANIHFVCLDSWLSDRRPDGPMLQWLRADLAAATQDWIIAYWHHPPYSWGTDFSDSTYILIQMREQVVPILERYGVDLVLCGHSHVYERSYLLNGHYGYSWTFNSQHTVDGSMGGADGFGPYRKPPVCAAANAGTVYMVCGNSGVGGPVNFQRHPAMAAKNNGYGSIVLDVDGPRLTAKYLRPGGAVDDHFTIDKSATRLAPPRLDFAAADGALTLTWPITTPEFQLEATTNFFDGDGWRPVGITPEAIGPNRQTTLPLTNAQSFFRLHANQ